MEEKDVELVLVKDHIFAQHTLGKTGIVLLEEQKVLPSGKLDLLYIIGKTLVPVEIKKGCKFPSEGEACIQQLKRYVKDLSAELVHYGAGKINAILLVCEDLTPIKVQQYLTKTLQKEKDIILRTYKMQDITVRRRKLINELREMFKETTRPSFKRINHLSLLNNVLYAFYIAKRNRLNMNEIIRKSRTYRKKGLTSNTVKYRLQYLRELGLVKNYDDMWEITQLGKEYIKHHSPGFTSLSEEQRRILIISILTDPFRSWLKMGFVRYFEVVEALSKIHAPIRIPFSKAYKLLYSRKDPFSKSLNRYLDTVQTLIGVQGWSTSTSTLVDFLWFFSTYCSDLGLIDFVPGRRGEHWNYVTLTERGRNFLKNIRLQVSINIAKYDI